jgi:excisionase family DNA binding protein
MIDENFLTTNEVIEYLQVNLRTGYRLPTEKKLRAVRVERQWRFCKTDIDAWLNRQRSSSIHPPTMASSLTQPVRQDVHPRVLVGDNETNIITGFSTESSAIKTANLGVFWYLTKPFKVSKVLEIQALTRYE